MAIFELYFFAGALGECYGFEIDNEKVNVTYTLHNSNSDAICIEGVDIFSLASQSKLI